MSSSAPAAAPLDDARWDQILRRDPAADGAFWLGVHTTGVYCYPSCPARRPLRRNVSFFATREAARDAGLRACRRCAPDLPPARERRARAIGRLCRRLDDGEPLSLAELAELAGLSPHHLHRVFKEVTGLTPAAYRRAARASRFRAALAASPSVTAAALAAGYRSSARVHADSAGRLGMTPSAYREGGAEAVVRVAAAPCRLGLVLVGATDRGVCAVFLGDDEEALRAELARTLPAATLAGPDAELAGWVHAVVRQVDEGTDAALPLDVQGTAFQHRVWDALRAIPRGETRTYGQLAAELDKPTAARAVARACATNPASILVPCHRVVGGDGALRGYRWGLERKRALLDQEREG